MILLAWLTRLPAWLWLCLALAAWGGWQRLGVLRLEQRTHAQAELLQAAQAATKAAAAVRKIDEGYHANASVVRRRGASVAERVRALPAAASSPAAAAECRDHEAAGAVISERAGADLVALAQRADEVATQLQACQAYVVEVTR